MHIADLGCGRTGHVVFPAALALGEMGMVYAVDIMKDVLENIIKWAAMDGFVNIHPIWADLEKIGQTSIPERSLDIVFLVNTLVQSNNKPSILEEAKRLLKEKARMVVVDWSRKGLPFGPSEERFVDFENVKQWAKKQGMAIQEEFDMGSYHHGLVLYQHD